MTARHTCRPVNARIMRTQPVASQHAGGPRIRAILPVLRYEHCTCAMMPRGSSNASMPIRSSGRSGRSGFCGRAQPVPWPQARVDGAMPPRTTGAGSRASSGRVAAGNMRGRTCNAHILRVQYVASRRAPKARRRMIIHAGLFRTVPWSGLEGRPSAMSSVAREAARDPRALHATRTRRNTSAARLRSGASRTTVRTREVAPATRTYCTREPLQVNRSRSRGTV